MCSCREQYLHIDHTQLPIPSNHLLINYDSSHAADATGRHPVLFSDDQKNLSISGTNKLIFLLIYLSACKIGDQRTTYRSWFSFSTLRVPGLNSHLQALGAKFLSSLNHPILFFKECFDMVGGSMAVEPRDELLLSLL